MNPRHFGTDLADIRIRINPEIQIRILDQIMALVEFVVSEFSCFVYYYSSTCLQYAPPLLIGQ